MVQMKNKIAMLARKTVDLLGFLGVDSSSGHRTKTEGNTNKLVLVIEIVAATLF